jgi:hypothetical protein
MKADSRQTGYTWRETPDRLATPGSLEANSRQTGYTWRKMKADS